MKMAICYDRVNKWGGAERVLLALHEIFPDASLYTSVYNSPSAAWANVFPKVVTSFLQNFPFAKNNHEYYPLLMPIAFESFSFDKYDLVISLTSEAAKGIITKPHTKHICICLTPTRYLWSGYKEYFPNVISRSLLSPITNYLRNWDKVAASRPDKMVAISTEVQKRIKKYYNRDSEILFPPVHINTKITKEIKNIPEKFFLVVSRLVPYKKVELAIKCFNKLNIPLVIIGEGKEKERLMHLANTNIIFQNLDSSDDESLTWFYKNCQALIFPQDEDFGLTAVECQAFGRPVIAFKSGGALDTVIDGKTGIFFEEQTVESLTIAIETFQKTNFSDTLIAQNAKRFSANRFKKELLKIIND